MKSIRFLSLLLFFALITGCGNTQNTQETTMSDEARTQLYQSAIEEARDAQLNESMSILTSPQDDMAELIFSLLGVTGEDMRAFALSVSPMNIKAYGIAAIYPAEGKEQTVLDGLNGFIDQQKQNFQLYLADQYDIASSARLETLEDGTILLVMCPDQDTVFDAIRSKIDAGA